MRVSEEGRGGVDRCVHIHSVCMHMMIGGRCTLLAGSMGGCFRDAAFYKVLSKPPGLRLLGCCGWHARLAAMHPLSL